MYHYLTGAASWYMLTVITEMFGAKGCAGNLMLEPKLERQQFDLDEKERSFSFRLRDSRCIWSTRTKSTRSTALTARERSGLTGELWDYSGGEKDAQCLHRQGAVKATGF